jgi:hypothetical protein
MGKKLVGIISIVGTAFYVLLEKMRITDEIYMTEDDFLMPTPTIRKILENRPAIS